MSGNGTTPTGSPATSRPKSGCPNCGSTEWTLRLGLGRPRSDGRPPLDVCNVCSPARTRPKARWWRKQATVNVWVWRFLWFCVYTNVIASMLRLARHFGG